jgi:hypothetical protein
MKGDAITVRYREGDWVHIAFPGEARACCNQPSKWPLIPTKLPEGVTCKPCRQAAARDGVTVNGHPVHHGHPGVVGVNGVGWDWVDQNRHEADPRAVAALDAWRKTVRE